MDYPNTKQGENMPERQEPSWFQVAGDVDDFIFYYETAKPCSQR